MLRDSCVDDCLARHGVTSSIGYATLNHVLHRSVNNMQQFTLSFTSGLFSFRKVVPKKSSLSLVGELMRLLFVLSLSLLAFGCSKEGKPCPADGSCGGELRCEPITKTCQSVCGKPADCKKGLTCDEREGVCFSERVRRKEIQCRTSKGCKGSGWCSAVDGGCKATKDEDCAESRTCKKYGNCFAVDGRCNATKDEDCINSTHACTVFGRCSAVNGKCKATKNEHCTKSDACTVGGNCSAVDGVCKPTKNEHCTKSDACRSGGNCSAVDGVCKPTKDEHCASSAMCTWHGQCSAVDGFCKPTKDEHCANSIKCSDHGKCSLVDGECVKH